MKTDLVKKVASTIEKYHMTDKSERLLVGLSGGADSAALLLCLHKLGYAVTACHVNHCIRGEEADRDQHFCEELCKGLGIPIEVRRVDVPEYCKTHPVSEEEGARLLRYQALSDISGQDICQDKIAISSTLSHHHRIVLFLFHQNRPLRSFSHFHYIQAFLHLIQINQNLSYQTYPIASQEATLKNSIPLFQS